MVGPKVCPTGPMGRIFQSPGFPVCRLTCPGWETGRCAVPFGSADVPPSRGIFIVVSMVFAAWRREAPPTIR